MKKHSSKRLKQKWVYTLLMLMLFIPFVLTLSMHQTSEFHQVLFNLNSWIQTHHTPFLLWHILIMAAIYYFWGVKVDRVGKKAKLTEREVKRLKRFRYVMIAFVFFIGCLTGLYGG